MKILITEKQLRLLIKEDKNIFIPRRMEDRKERHKGVVLRQIQGYIKNGSKGELDLSNTPIRSLPDNLKVDGDLYLYDSFIQSLPDNLTVNGILDLRDSTIISLPNNLEVNGDLDLSNTPIRSLPDNLKVGGDLYISNTPLSKGYSKDEIRKMIEDKGGSLGGNIYI